ncbi:hypothetical protein V8E51_003087 [Hyaloscypha variabilis]
MSSSLNEEAPSETRQALGAERIGKRKAERKISEYEESNSHRDKYSSTKQSRTASKAEAGKELKNVSTKVTEKQSSLQQLVTKGAKTLIPTMLAQGGRNSIEREDLQNLVDSLKKERAKDEKMIEEQGLLIVELRGVTQTLHEKNQPLAKSVHEKHSKMVLPNHFELRKGNLPQHKNESKMTWLTLTICFKN